MEKRTLSRQKGSEKCIECAEMAETIKREKIKVMQLGIIKVTTLLVFVLNF